MKILIVLFSLLFSLLLSTPIISAHNSSCVVSGIVYNTKSEEGLLVKGNECDINIEVRNDYIIIWDKSITMRARLPELKGWASFWYKWERTYIYIENIEYHIYVSNITAS